MIGARMNTWSYDACHSRMDSPHGRIDLRVEFSSRMGDYHWAVMIDVKEDGRITTKRKAGRHDDMDGAKAAARRTARVLARRGWTMRDEKGATQALPA